MPRIPNLPETWQSLERTSKARAGTLCPLWRNTSRPGVGFFREEKPWRCAMKSGMPKKSGKRLIFRMWFRHWKVFGGRKA